MADKGYYKAEDLKKLVENGITPYETKQIYSNGTGDKDFYSDRFIYDKEKKYISALQVKSSIITETGER